MNPGKTSQRPFSHPLFGSSLSNLIRLIWTNDGVSWKYSPQLLAALLSATGRLPLSLIEKITFHNKLKRLKMKPPLFIVGHWRSGTTHLCNLLSQSPEFGFVTPVATGIPHDLLLIGRLFKPWLEHSIPPDRLIDRVAVNAKSPQEDEFGLANMVPISFLHGLYFPKHFTENFSKGVFFDNCSEKEIERWKRASSKYLKKVYLDQGQRQLLIRNPVYTARIPLLRSMWPGAKFIHIYRNPYRVFPSMRNYFQKLFPALALQDYRHVDADAIIFSTYKRMMETLIRDLAQLPVDEFIEIKYEQLEERPLAELEKVYTRLGLSGYQEAEPFFEKYLDGIRGYTKNQYLQDPTEVKLIRHHWHRIINHYGY